VDACGAFWVGNEMSWRCHGQNYAELVSNLQSKSLSLSCLLACSLHVTGMFFCPFYCGEDQTSCHTSFAPFGILGGLEEVFLREYVGLGFGMGRAWYPLVTRGGGSHVQN